MFLKVLDTNQKLRSKISILEITNMIIEEYTLFNSQNFIQILFRSEKYFESQNNVRNWIQKIGNLLYEDASNKQLILPCLGIIYYLRDKNSNQTLSCIVYLPNQQLQNVFIIS